MFVKNDYDLIVIFKEMQNILHAVKINGSNPPALIPKRV